MCAIVCRYQYQQRKDGLLPRTPDNLFSPQKIRCHHPKCPKMLSNHCGNSARGSANKLTNLQEQSKMSNNQLNSIQSAPLNNHDDINNLSDNSEIQSLNNTLSATMDEKQKMLLLKIANNSIAAASAVASVADNDYGNVSVSFFDNAIKLNLHTKFPSLITIQFQLFLPHHSHVNTQHTNSMCLCLLFTFFSFLCFLHCSFILLLSRNDNDKLYGKAMKNT
jgi:hypothetical protein